MTIYGVAILAACFLVGQFTGEVLGHLLAIDANVGGVGFSMFLLIVVNQWLNKGNLLPKDSQLGISFWSNMYIPVIVAMSSTQNVSAALSGGAVAIAAGTFVTIIPLLMLPLISKLANKRRV